MIDPSIALQVKQFALPSPTELIGEQQALLNYQRAKKLADYEDEANKAFLGTVNGGTQPQTQQFGQPVPNQQSPFDSEKYQKLMGNPVGREILKNVLGLQKTQEDTQAERIKNAQDVLAFHEKNLQYAQSPEDVSAVLDGIEHDSRLNGVVPPEALAHRRQLLANAVAANKFQEFLRTTVLGAEKASAQHFGQMDLGGKIVQTVAPEYALPGTIPGVAQINSEQVTKSPNARNTVVNVNTGAGAKEAEKGFGQELPKEFSAMQVLRDTVATRQKALRLLDKAAPYMGLGGSAKLAAAKGLRAAGENYDKEGVEAAEQISGIATLLAGPLLKASDPNPSEKQMERMEKAIGNLSLEPGTFRNQITDSINKDLGKIQSYNDRYNQAVANGLRDLSVNKIELPNPNVSVKLKVLGVNGKAASEIPRTIKKGDWIKVIKNGSYHKLVYDGTGDPGNLTNYSEKQ